MISGSKVIEKTPAKVMDRLKVIMAGANCEILASGENSISFRHGTYLTQTAPMLPKLGIIRLSEQGNSTLVHYSIKTAGLIRVWLVLMAVILCWAIFPPILVYRTLVHHPRVFMENLLAGV